jgi:transposase
VVLLETRHVKAALSAMTVKTDRKDARGIAQLLSMGWYRPVHAKSSPAQDTRALLVGRKLWQSKLLDVELRIRGILRGYGLKVGEVSRGRFEARIRELIAGHATLSMVIDAMLTARAALWTEFTKLHREMLRIARADRVCQRLMTAPGVGALVALTYRSAVNDPARFEKSSTVGAYPGLTPKKYQSGETDRDGGGEQGRRLDGANRIVRVRAYHADAGDALFQSEALGARCGQASRDEAREGCPCTQTRCRASPQVGGCDGLSLNRRPYGGMRRAT